MIDLHCHLLPGVDDGARDMAQALKLARAAVENGITHCVATPHIHIGRFPNTIETIQCAFISLKAELEANKIPLRLGVAAEVRIAPEILTMVTSGQMPYLGQWHGERVILLELPHSHIPPGVEQLVGWLRKKNIRTMIPHPERNKDIIRDFNKILPLVRMGCLFQLTAGAVVGHFGEPAAQRAREMLERGMVTILATDAHHEDRRPPVLEEGRRAAAEIVGEEQSWQLVRQNPARIAARHFTVRGSRA